MTTQRELARTRAKVKAVNAAHTVANEVFRQSREALQQFDGQKVTKADGYQLLKKVADKMPSFPHTHNLMVYRNINDYSWSWTVKTNEQVEGESRTLTYEKTVYIADLSDGTITKLYDKYNARTDYDADAIIAQRKVVEDAKKKYEAEKSKLWPFGTTIDA